MWMLLLFRLVPRRCLALPGRELLLPAPLLPQLLLQHGSGRHWSGMLRCMPGCHSCATNNIALLVHAGW